MKIVVFILSLLAVVPKTYQELPLGDIRPEGWLKEVMERQRDGISANLDELYPEVLGSRNGWLGGDGDQWERGPYWIDGLLPMAYQLGDESLKAKVQPWIEWTLASQREDGFFGPAKDYSHEPGLQRNNSEDWWPRMVMLKVLQQYYSATQDARVIEFLTKYFHYQLETLPQKPLGHWTEWAEFRQCDNMLVAIWLYGITGDKKLLELGDLLHSQGYDYTHMFLETNDLQKFSSIHGVNLAQGLKEPVVYWQLNRDDKYLKAVDTALADLRKFNGFPNGMFSGDELLHGNNPTQGIELCMVAEFMFSLEQMMQITGDAKFAELLERVAFNALPAQTTDDFTARQYFQQANQVMVTRGMRNFDINHNETDLVFGLLTGYPCCTCNMHQAWPKFTQNLWYKTDKGLAAMVYAPCSVNTEVNGVKVNLTERTSYPMGGKIVINVGVDKRKGVSFPISLYVPSWSNSTEISVNGEPVKASAAGNSTIIDRKWKNGDSIEISFGMGISTQTWYENSVSIERGPLVYALKVKENWKKQNIDPSLSKGTFYWDVTPGSDWNYGLVSFGDANAAFRVEEKESGSFPWSADTAPISIYAKAKKIPSWSLYGCMAGPLPYSNMTFGVCPDGTVEEEVELIPYGCTTLRISEFPVIN